MIKTCIALFVLIASAFSVAYAQSPAREAGQTAAWELVKPEGANFSIEFPAPPAVQTVPAEGGLAWKVLTLDQKESSGRVFTIEYMSTTESAPGRKADGFWVGNAFKQELNRIQHATVNEEWEYEVCGHEVREAIYTHPGVTYKSHQRFWYLLTDQHIYVAWVTGPSTEDLKSEAVVRFFKSFKLLKGCGRD